MRKKIAVLPGDGIGPEVMHEAIKVLDATAKKHSLDFNYEYADVGGTAHDKHGTALPDKTLQVCKSSDAILFGSVGGPKWDNLPKEKKIERSSLLALRKYFGFYANLRPAILYPQIVNISPIKGISLNGFDIMVVRELSGDAYFGNSILEEDWASDEMKYTKQQCRRIAKIAFEIAMKRKKHVTCVDKSNVLSSSIFFRNSVTEVSKTYPDVKMDCMYIDNATMQIIKRPMDFDVIVTTNLFGDILSDEAAMLTGSIGMLPSVSLNENGFGLYEPAGGSAPDIAGKGIANPIAQILCAALMLRYSFNMEKPASSIEGAVKKILEDGYRTKDIIETGMKEVGTKEMGNLIAEKIK
ncbi:3-isopropylmalate dehydrogenase [Candidatus Woesearchaeota archaeon]|nr:3-isopropylmalate dehydrogenase [Candidatus Woesearchaeota archaeon]